MNKFLKTTMAAVVSTGLILGAVAPMAASARPASYVCQAEKSKDSRTGLILGAIAGGLLGTQISKHEKGLGALGGAVVGGVVGSKLGKDHGKATCNKIEAQAREEYGYRSYGRTSYRYYDRHNHRYAYAYR